MPHDAAPAAADSARGALANLLDYDSIAGYLGCHRSHRLADGGHVARRCIFHRRGIGGERLCELCALLGEFRARRPERVLGKLLRRFVGDTDNNGVLTRAELARLEAPASSCEANPHTLRTRGKWTGLERVCHAVLCDHGRSRELKRANRTQWRALVEGHPACLRSCDRADCKRSVAVVLSGGFTSPTHKYGQGAGSLADQRTMFPAVGAPALPVPVGGLELLRQGQSLEAPKGAPPCASVGR